MNRHIYIHTYAYIYIHVCIHIYIYMYTDTHTSTHQELRHFPARAAAPSAYRLIRLIFFRIHGACG